MNTYNFLVRTLGELKSFMYFDRALSKNEIEKLYKLEEHKSKYENKRHNTR